MDQRNLILAIVLSVTILLTFQIFFAPTPPDPGTQATTATGSSAIRASRRKTEPCVFTAHIVSLSVPTAPRVPDTRDDRSHSASAMR
jgi:hypothetical protein